MPKPFPKFIRSTTIYLKNSNYRFVSAGSLVIEKEISVAGFLSSNTDIRMSSSGPLFCIIFDQKKTNINMLTRLDKGVDIIEESNNYSLPGFSWNLDAGNNRMCRLFIGK